MGCLFDIRSLPALHEGEQALSDRIDRLRRTGKIDRPAPGDAPNAPSGLRLSCQARRAERLCNLLTRVRSGPTERTAHLAAQKPDLFHRKLQTADAVLRRDHRVDGHQTEGQSARLLQREEGMSYDFESASSRGRKG